MSVTSRSAETERIAGFYDELLARHGEHPRALGWGSHRSQETRFAALTDVADLGGATVLDVGCGLADLHAFLDARGVDATYTGYDIAPAVLDAARRRFPDLDLRLGDLMEHDTEELQFDFVLASGLFNLRPEHGYGYLAAMARQMYDVCRRGVAFNSLSTRSDLVAPGQFLADPVRVLDLCFDITPRVVVRHDYLPHDFTVYLYRPDASPRPRP